MHLASLHRYPIKGCRGHALDHATIDRLGIVGDRRLMVVDSTGRFLTQREAPLLATITPDLVGDALTVHADGRDPLAMTITPDGAPTEVVIWDDALTATDQGDQAARWFSQLLDRPCRLVHFGEHARRPIDPRYAPRADAETAFTDGYPMLGVLQESLDDLNARLVAPVPMDRFRPNLVFAGAPAWSEDHWTEITLGDLTLDAVKPCARCVVTTKDQRTGAAHPEQEPLRTLATFRTIAGRGTMFGVNLVARGSGDVRRES
jgi:uncharacterized protein YcbX